MKKKKDDYILKGVLKRFPQKTNSSRVYDEVMQREFRKMALNVDVKPHIDTAIKDGYIDKILDMIDDDILEAYLRRKKLEKIIGNIKK